MKPHQPHEVTLDFDLDLLEIERCENHTLLNLMQMLGLSLSYLHGMLPEPLLPPLEEEIKQCRQLLQKSTGFKQNADRLIQLCERIHEASLSYPPPDQLSTETIELINFITDAAISLEHRIQERKRRESPTAPLWKTIRAETFLRDCQSFLMNQARFSQGRFQIVTDPEKMTENSYFFQAEAHSHRSQQIQLPVPLFEVTLDLLSNARKYSKPPAHLSLCIRETEETLFLEVSDTGQGIPSDEISHCIRPGYRASNSTGKTSFGGGYGLTKAAYWSKRLGGKLIMYSSLGEGTLILVEIPIPTERLLPSKTASISSFDVSASIR